MTISLRTLDRLRSVIKPQSAGYLNNEDYLVINDELPGSLVTPPSQARASSSSRPHGPGLTRQARAGPWDGYAQARFEAENFRKDNINQRLMRFNAISKNREPKVALDADQRLGLWRSRPWQHRALYRFNVFSAYAGGLVTARHVWEALRNPHQVVMLPLRSPRRAMIFVCPAAVREYEEACRAGGSVAHAKSVALEAPEQLLGARVKDQTVDSSERSP
jgi:hypothetical protein